MIMCATTSVSGNNLSANRYRLRMCGSLLISMLLLYNTLLAQHYQFSQFYSAPTYLNPAFTGSDACSRISLSYRDQWPSIPGAFVSYQVSYDHYVPLMHSGIGFVFFSDKSGHGGLRTNLYSLLYAVELKLSKKYFCRLGVQPGIATRSVNFSDLVFGDQIARGGAPTTVENPVASTIYFDVSTGILLYSKQTWFGVSAMHINEPNQTLVDRGYSPLPMELRVHAGRKFYPNSDSKRDDNKHFSVAFNYKAQLKFDQFDIGTYYTIKPLVVGLWYRGIPFLKAYKPGYQNNDAVSALVGFVWKKFNIGYSYDLTISRLTYQSGGSHELSLRYDLCKNKKSRIRSKKILVPCPKF